MTEKDSMQLMDLAKFGLMESVMKATLKSVKETK